MSPDLDIGHKICSDVIMMYGERASSGTLRGGGLFGAGSPAWRNERLSTPNKFCATSPMACHPAGFLQGNHIAHTEFVRTQAERNSYLEWVHTRLHRSVDAND